MSNLFDALVDGTCDASAFDHAAHLRAAFEGLQGRDFFEAAWLYSAGLRRLTQKAGVPEKYNATLTLTYLSLVAERMDMSEAQNAEDFLAAHPDLLNHKAVRALWPGKKAMTDLARRVPLMPRIGSEHPS